MATEKKDRQANDIWQRLEDLGEEFRRAALRERNEGLLKMGRVLTQLSGDPSFRPRFYESAHKSLKKYLSKRSGLPVFTKNFEGHFLLETVKGAIANRTDAKGVTRAILHDLSLSPELYIAAKDAPGIDELVRKEGHSYRAATKRVEAAIAPLLADPDAAEPEKVLRYALRALGCPNNRAKHIVRDTRNLEGLAFLETVERALARHEDPQRVSRVILLDLQWYPEMCRRAKAAPDIEHLYRGDGDDFQGAVERVGKAIEPTLDSHDAKPESVAKAALRALGCGARYVESVFST